MTVVRKLIMPIEHLLLLVLLCTLAAAPALAQDDDGPEALYRSALGHYAAGKYDQAVPYFQRLIDIFGREPSLQEAIEKSYYGLGCSYYNVGMYMECIETFKKMIELYPKANTLDEAYFRMAAAYQYEDNFEEAIKAYQVLTGTWPRSPFAEDASFYTGLAFMSSDKSAEAVAAFEIFVEKFPRSDLVPQALVYMARSYFDAGDYVKALETLESVGDKTASLDHLVFANFLAMEIGDAAFEETDYHIALRAFRRVRTNESLIRFQKKLITEAEEALERLRNMKVEPSELARQFRAERRVMASLTTLNQALEKLESTPDYDASLFHRIGRCFYSIDRFWEAHTAYKRVVDEAKDPILQEACHFDLVLVLNRLRHFGELIEEADRYLDAYGEDEELIKNHRVPSVAFMRAEAYINQELFEEAETEMARLERTYPEHVQMPRIRFYRALSIAMQERFKESIDLFEKWLKDYPNHIMGGEVAYWYPIAMFYDGQYERAIPLFDQYVEEYSMTVYAPEAAYRSALCKYAMEDFEQSAAELAVWLEEHPDHIFKWEARVTLGDAYSAIGELEKAKEAYLGVTSEAGPMEYLALTQLNKVFKALETEKDFRQMADVHIRFIQNNPNSPNMIESAYNAGWALQQIDRTDEARRLYWMTIERFGNNRMWDGFGPLLQDLHSMYRNISLTVLEEDFEKLINKSRASRRYTLVARLVMAQLSWRDMTDLERAEEMERRFNLDDLDAEILAFMGNAFAQAGEVEKGQPLLDKVLEEFPESRFVDVAYARKADALVKAGKYADALVAADVAIEKAMETKLMMEAVYAKALALKGLERYKDAVDEFNNVLASRASPKQLKPMAMLEAASCQEALKEYNKAIPYYQRIYVMYTAYEDATVQAYLRSAAAFEKIKDREAAIRTYQEMLTTESLAEREELAIARKNLVRLGGEIPVIEKPEPKAKPEGPLPMDQVDVEVES